MERFHSRDQHLCKFIGKLSFPEEEGSLEREGFIENLR